MANDRPSILKARMNMVISIFGFLLSAGFMFVICGRLLCSRLRQANTTVMLQSGRRSLGSSSVERSLQGLEPSTVASFPTVNYNQQVFTSSVDNLCTICLGDYKEKEVLRILPRCGHTFHATCIDLWLRQRSSCPVCRISLRIFSQWRRTSDPLISFSAKSRFLPGALPDSMFEQPGELRSVPVVVPTGFSKEGVVHPVSYKPATVADKSGMEMAESSMSTRLDTTELTDEGKFTEDMEKLLRPQVNIVPDCNSSIETNIIVDEVPVEHSIPTLRWHGSLASSSSREGSASFQPGISIHRSDTGRTQEGPSFSQTGSSDAEDHKFLISILSPSLNR